MSLLRYIPVYFLFAVMCVAAFASPPQNDQGAKQDMKNAGHSAKHAAKETGRATKTTAQRTGHTVKNQQENSA